MVMQQETQEVEPPRQFGVLLTEAPARLSQQNNTAVQQFEAMLNYAAAKSRHQSKTPIQVADKIPAFEGNVATGEFLVNVFLGSFVNLVHQAAQDDERAHAFDVWADGQDLAIAFDTYERTVVPLYKESTAILRKVVKGWNRRAKAGELEPGLPPELARRVEQLDKRIRKLTRQITKKEDNELIARLLIRVGNHRPLTAAEKIRLSDAVRVKVKYKIEPSERRADWYGDNAR